MLRRHIENGSFDRVNVVLAERNKRQLFKRKGREEEF